MKTNSLNTSEFEGERSSIVKILSRIALVVLAILVLLVVARNQVVKFSVEKGVRIATGLDLEIKKLDIGLTTTHVGIKELSLLNPKGFPKGAMFYAPEIFVDYHLGDMIKGKVHLENVKLHFDKFVIVKNKDGMTNLDALKPKEDSSKTSDQKKEDKSSKKKEKLPEIQIDQLSLKLGKLVYEDYSKGGEPNIKEFEVNISEEFKDVTNIQAMLAVIATKAIAKTTLSTAFNFGKDVFKDASGVSGQAVDMLKNKADALKDKIKLPFGK